MLRLVQNQATQRNHNSESKEKKSETRVRSSSASKSKAQATQLKECSGADSKELDKKSEACDVTRKECVGTVGVNGKRVQYPKIKSGRYTLDWWKCYLDSCASYHTFFVREFLRHVQDSSTTMNGSCNAGSVMLREKGWYKNFQVWLNENGIVNLLSIPMLEEAGYKVSTHTDRDWEVTTP